MNAIANTVLAQTIASGIRPVATVDAFDSLADRLASFDDSADAICAASADAWLDSLASDLAEFGC
jgi:hypothetical protein